MRKNDAPFLYEYAEFSLQIPLATAEVLHDRLIEAQAEQDFDLVAKLQVRLHAEMVLAMEVSGALLLAFSKWDQPGGILQVLLDYQPRQIREFLGLLLESENSLELLCIPEKNVVKEHFDEAEWEFVDRAHTSDELRRLVHNICHMYMEESITTAYNKLKHACMVIRNPAVLGDEFTDFSTSSAHMIARRDEHGVIDILSFEVMGEEGMALANKYLNNARVIVDTMKQLTNFYAYFLERGLLPSTKKIKG